MDTSEAAQSSQDLKSKMHRELIKLNVDQTIGVVIAEILKKTENQVIEDVKNQALYTTKKTENQPAKNQDIEVVLPNASQNEWNASVCTLL